MKPRRPTEFEVFNSNVKQVITKSDSITEDVQKSRIPFKLDTYLGTSGTYFSDNGTQYIEGKQDIVFRLSSIPLRVNSYSKLKSSTYCKPFIKTGNSVYGDGVKKYYSTPSFSNGTPLGVNRYLSIENNGTSIYYYFLGDGTDGTVNGVKYYVRPDDVTNNYLVPFKTAIIEDKIIYPILVFVDGFFIPWSRCYFAISYESFNIYINMENLKYNSSSYLIDKVRTRLITGEINPVFYMLPFEVNYGENVSYSNTDKNKTIFTFDSYGRSYMSYSEISDNTKVTYVEAAINIKNIAEVSSTDIYDQVSDLFYCEVNSGEPGSFSSLGRTVVNFNKLDRMRKLFPVNIIVFNRDDDSELNLTLCTDTVRIYNNIVYVGNGTTYYDQHIKVFFDSTSALSLTNLEFVSQSWLENYTDTLVNFYAVNGVNYVDSGEQEVHNNENRPIGLKVVNGILNAEFDPKASDTYDLLDATQLGYTIKEGILCLEFDELNPNKLIINDNYISEQLNSGSLLMRYSMDMDQYDFDELNCFYYNAITNTRTQIPVDKSTFFNLFNKIYHNDVYNKNRGKLPIMDQTIVSDQVFEIRDLGNQNSIYSYNVGQNLSLKSMSFNDETFTKKINETIGSAIGKYKFTYIVDNPRNDRYGYTTIDSELQPGSTIDPDSIKMRSAKFVADLMKDDVDSPLGLEVGFKGYQYNAKINYTAYTDYTYATVAANIPGYTASDGKLLIPVEVTEDVEHNSYYFTVGTSSYYVKEYSNEYYDSEEGKVVDKTGTYNLDKNYMDFSGIMTTMYDPSAGVVNEARMNNVQLSNTEISVQPNESTTANLADVDLQINVNKYTSNFDYNIASGSIITTFVCTNGGSLTYENTGATVTISDEELLYNTFGNRVGTYQFDYDSDNSQWIVNGSLTFATLSECGITYSGTNTFVIIIKNNTYPSWTLDGESVDVDEVYGIKFNGICLVDDVLSLTFTKNITGMIEETYDPDAVNCQTIMNDYLQLKLVDGVTNVVYDNYLTYNDVDPYHEYPGRIEFVYNEDNDDWTVTVYRYITDDLVYKTSFEYGNLEGFAIEYEGSPVDGDMIIVYYEPPVFKWNMYKAVPTNTDDFIDGYLYPEEPTAEDIALFDYGIGIKATITQTSIINAKIYNEDLLAEKFDGSAGTYIFRYNASQNTWYYQNDNIQSLRDYGIDINGSIPVDGDYIITSIDTTNKPSWMDSVFVTIYEVNVNCLEFPDGTYYNKEIAADIILEKYGADISEYIPNIKSNDKIIFEYTNSVGIPRYILNLLINKFNYYDTFNTDESYVEDTFMSSYETHDDKVSDIFKDYKLYEYQLSTMLLNNQSIFDKYLKESFSSNLRFAEYTREYLLNNIAKLISDKYYIDIPVKNRYAYMMDFENMFLNFYTNDNLIKSIDSNIFRYQLGLDKISGTKTPVEFMFFDNIDNSEYTTRFSNTNKYRRYDPSIFNENMRLYTTEAPPEDNEFIYPEFEDDHPVDMEFSVKYTINRIKYRGILKPGSSESSSIFTPDAAKGDFYYLDYADDESDFINGSSIYDLFLPPEPEPEPEPDPDEDSDSIDTDVDDTEDEEVDTTPVVYEDPPPREEVHSTYKILLCVKDVYSAEDDVFDEIKPSLDGSTSWVLVSGPDLIDEITLDDYSMLVLDQEYINITLDNEDLYDTDLTIVSNNRFVYHQFQYHEPTGDYGAISSDTNSILLVDDNYHDIFRYCDDSSRYMIFIAEATDDSHTEYRYISSDQYRVSIPNDYNAPYYMRKAFFTFKIPDNSYIAVFYIPISMQAVEFQQRTEYQDGTVIFDINYESKKDLHYTFNSELYMIFADGRKIPQSWIEKIGPDKLAIKDPNQTRSISYNNISIVKYIPTTLEARFDSYIDSNELTTVGEFDPTSEEFMKYVIKIGLSKEDILNIIEKLAYRHRYADMGTSYYIDDSLTLNNYGSGMSEFVYWLYNDMSSTSEQKLAVFNYDAIDMDDINSFAENNKFIESTVKLIRQFYIENTLVPYNTHENPDPTFSYHDNIAAKSEGLTSNSRYANDPSNIYVYPVLQDYRFDVIFGTYNLYNLTTNAKTVINPGETNYSFYIYSVNSSILPENIIIRIDSTGVILQKDRDYSYNSINGEVVIFSITDNFTVTAYGERVSYIEMTQPPDKTLYYTTEKFDPTGMVIVIHWIDGSTEFLTDYTYDHYNELLTTDVTEITVIYRDSDYFDYELTIPIEVKLATAEINYVLSNDGTYYLVGDGTNGSGLVSIPENGNIIIPDTIYDVENNIVYPVKIITDGAFRDIEDINIITLGANIYNIGEYAFSGCTASSITLNQGLLTIGNGAFKDCENIAALVIPNSVVSVGISIARGCIALLSATISNSLTAITQTMFEGCTSLMSIVIPENITSLGLECFSECTALAHVTMYNNITSIGEKAFYNCSSLTEIDIPENIELTIIKEYAFSGTALTSIYIPNNVNVVEDSAFANCASLTSAEFQAPEGVRIGINNLGKLIFNGCGSLVDVKFGFNSSIDKCSSEDDAWFKDCNTSLSIKVPYSIYNPSESIDLTITNYGTKWNYISAGNDATYYSTEN